MSDAAWLGAAIAAVVFLGLLGPVLLWTKFADQSERALRATRYVGTVLVAAALACGGVVVAYGVTALDEAAVRSSSPTIVTTKKMTVTESDPKTTVTEERKVEPAATAAEQAAILGALLAFSFGLAAVGGLLLTRERAATEPAMEAEVEPAALVESAIYAAMRSRHAADAAASTQLPFARRQESVRSAGREAIDAARNVMLAVELDLPRLTAVQAVTAASDAISSGQTAVAAADGLVPPGGVALAAAAGDASRAANDAAAAAEGAAAHLDAMAIEEPAVA